jgi:hypothetical protein
MLFLQYSTGIFETIDHKQSHNVQSISCKIRQENIKTFYILSNDNVHFCDQKHFSQQLETFLCNTHLKNFKTHYWEHETN